MCSSSPTLNGDVLDDIVVGDKVDHDPDFTPANRLTKVPLHIFVSNGDGTFTHAPELVRLEPPLVYRNNGSGQFSPLPREHFVSGDDACGYGAMPIDANGNGAIDFAVSATSGDIDADGDRRW